MIVLMFIALLITFLLFLSFIIIGIHFIITAYGPYDFLIGLVSTLVGIGGMIGLYQLL